MRCYFDIETSGNIELTVAGIYFEDGRFVQLIGPDIGYNELYELLDNTVVYTYNGSRFDIPVVYRCTGLKIDSIARSHDLMYDCWRKNLYGGLKKVEKVLGIERETEGMNGHDAVILWERYTRGDRKALDTLLRYNRDDVINLELLRKKLEVF